MAKFPTYEEMGKKVAEKALDEFLYNGKSIREWMQIITLEDAISRQAVNTLVDELARAISDERCYISRGRDTATIMQDILDLPPVAQQSKTGHWIVHPDGIYAHLVCDKCLSNAPYDCRTNYCPNCGAKMEGE